PSDCALRIADIWRSGYGVVVLPVITKLDDVDARGREAAIISLRRIGLTNLVNAARPKFPQLANVSPEDWAELGVMELIRVFKLYKDTESKCCYIWDVPLNADEIETWYGVCPTPYRSEVSYDELSIPSPRIVPCIAQLPVSEKIVTAEEKVLLRRVVEICTTLKTGRWNGTTFTQRTEDEEIFLMGIVTPHRSRCFKKQRMRSPRPPPWCSQ
ncbi:hypothetical protein AAVH_14517, partial [Aphelenchoides avenae]